MPGVVVNLLQRQPENLFMTAHPARRPFLPTDIKRERPGAAVARAALVAAKSEFSTENPNAVAVRMYPNDPVISSLVSRAAVAPASLTGSGWAAELAAATTIDFIGSMTVQSAAAKLID